jgi:chromosomal replication initiator protein
MNAQTAWQATVGQLQIEMSKASFDTWVRSAEFINCENSTITIGVPNAYARDWLDKRLTSTVSRILSNLLEAPHEAKFIVYHKDYDDSVETVREEKPQKSNAPLMNEAVAQARPTINSRYTFESFVVGPSNRLAHAACMAVAENPAHAYYPLFVYGGVGLGKTHLLHAIGDLARQRGKSILYVTSEDFTNELINSIRTHSTQAFRERYRYIDVLLIDDIQFISGKESTQEEFFHTFNTLHDQEKQIVISSDRPPKAMSTLEERLRSRFEWGLIADIQPPDLETRTAILRTKAERMRHEVPANIIDFIAHQFQSNIRELEGALTRVVAFADLRGKPLTIDLAEIALTDMIPQKGQLEPARVVDVVASAFGISREKLMGRERTREAALPRQVVMYLLREEANVSLPQIGEVLGGRDHTTVIYACEKVANLIERDDRLRRQIVQIRETLYGRRISA